MPWYLWFILALCAFVYLTRERNKQNRKMMQLKDKALKEDLQNEVLGKKRQTKEALRREGVKQAEVETEALEIEAIEAEVIPKEAYWVGQTQTELIASLGEPVVVDVKPLKSKRREVWKYEQTGKNRFALKLTLEDGLVVGWERK